MTLVYSIPITDAHNSNICFEKDTFVVVLIDTEPQGEMTLNNPLLSNLSGFKNEKGLEKYITSIYTTCGTLYVNDVITTEIKDRIRIVERIFDLAYRRRK